MLESDPQAQAMLKDYNSLPMPNQNLSDTEVQQYLKYFHWFDTQPTPPVASSGAGH
jgi:nitrite reductase (NO-forming)